MEMQYHCCSWLKGLIILVLGVLFMLGNLGIMDFTFAKWWPAFLILGGLFMLVKSACCYGKK